MNGNANDDNLREALALYEKEWLASLPSDEELEGMYTMSPRFMRRMARLFSRQSKPYYPYVNRAWKRALIAAVLALLLFAASMSVSAIREPVIRFVIEVYEKFSSLFYKTQDEIEIGAIYSPTYLPKGFIHAGSELVGIVSIQRYENTEGAEITFRQYPLREFEMQGDTEGLTLEEVAVNEYEGVYYQKNSWSTLVWSDEKYTFTLVAKIDKFNLIKIAQSVEIVE